MNSRIARTTTLSTAQKTAQKTAQGGVAIDYSWKLADQSEGLRNLLAWSGRLDRAWRYPFLRTRIAILILLLTLAAVCALRAWIGLSGMQSFSHDAFMPLDGAWRLMNGQRPHLDFYSFIGVLAYLPTAAGLRLAHGGAEGFGYAQALVGLLLGTWAYWLTRKRLPDVPAALFCLAVTLLCTAPFALGYTPLEISPATVYNRHGYAALALLILEAFTRRAQTLQPAEFRGGFSSGLLLVLLFFLKVTFFGAGLFLIAALGFCRAQSARRLAGLAAGAVAASLAFCAYFGFHMAPMFRDLIMVAGGKRIHFRSYSFDAILAEAGMFLSFAALACAVLILHRRHRSARSVAIGAAAVCFSGLLLTFGNAEPHGLPLHVFFVLIAASQLDFGSSGPGHVFRNSVLLCATVFTASALAPSALGFGYAAFLKGFSAPHEIPIAGRALSNFVPIAGDSEYRAFVNDGLALIQRNRLPADTVMSLDFTNPFSYVLGMKPAPGGTTALDYQTTFNDAHRPTAEALFGSASLVMAPKSYSDFSLQDSIPRLYGPYLEKHFSLVAESARWRLYRALP